ncbi:hypothetical protein LIER_24128 [Lithospermum erythrorhizon]|uniref:Uncharacterized protein n=1 Tax=Lithospermum erythrorhizon TaxID=34254 RepID=A0AAV3R372_LITER
MVKARGGSSSSSRKKGSQNSRTSNRVGMTADGQPIPLQVITPHPSQQAEIIVQKPKVLLLPWKDNVALEESNSEHREQFQPEHSGTNKGMCMHVPPTGDNVGKNPILGSTSAEKVALGDVNHERGSKNVEGVQPDVKDTLVETSFKSAKTHSSGDPTVAEILVGSDVGEGVDSLEENQDDDVVVVSYTVSRRRIRASVAALERKRVALGVGGDISGSVEPVYAIDLEELERLVDEKKAVQKGKEDFEGGDIARRKSKEKLKVNDDRNRINNRRIAKGVKDMSTEGVQFYSKKNEARHFGRRNEGITGSTLKLADIIKTLTGNALSAWLTKEQL